MEKINNDRTRSFLEEPHYSGCPCISNSRRYFRSKLEEFRKNNTEFDVFLKGIEQEIINRKITYCDNILLFIKGEAETNWISPSRSLFRALIKLYNYDFSAKQAVDHIERCHISYQRLLNDKLEMNNEYEIFTTRSRWDSSIKDFVELSLSPKRENTHEYKPYFIRVTFCSLQVDLGSYPYNSYPTCDNKIDLIADESSYDDAISLFDYCNGNRFARRVMDVAIKELIKNKIIGEYPIDAESALSKTPLRLYQVKMKRYLKIKEDNNEWR